MPCLKLPNLQVLNERPHSLLVHHRYAHIIQSTRHQQSRRLDLRRLRRQLCLVRRIHIGDLRLIPIQWRAVSSAFTRKDFVMYCDFLRRDVGTYRRSFALFEPCSCSADKGEMIFECQRVGRVADGIGALRLFMPIQQHMILVRLKATGIHHDP